MRYDIKALRARYRTKGLPEAVQKLIAMRAINRPDGEIMNRLDQLNGITVTVDFTKLPRSVIDEAGLASLLGIPGKVQIDWERAKTRTVKPPSGMERDIVISATVKLTK